MAPLPKRPERSAPIPNEPFDSPEVTSIKGPYWDMALGSGLEPDPYGSIQTSGSSPSEPTAYLYGPNGFAGVGAGLQIGPNGELEQSGGGYIYCTPAYPELPVTYPPYGCNTEVNTTGVTSFYEAWYDCQELTEFPCVDSSSVTDFSYAWKYCYGLTSFPSINTSAGENFTYSWAYSGLTSFPKLNTSNGVDFYCAWYYCSDLESFSDLDMRLGEDFGYAWYGCESLTSFPFVNVSSGKIFDDAWGDCSGLTSFPLLDMGSGEDFDYAWWGCENLTTFPAGMFDSCLATSFNSAWYNCALNQTSVNNILISLDTAGQSNGTVNLNGGTSAAPSGAGLAAKVSLQSRGWTVVTN
jgi:hypothetical protein